MNIYQGAAIALIALLSTQAGAQSKLTAQFVEAGIASEHSFPVDTPSLWDTTTTKRFAPTTGKCEGVDTSKLRDSVTEGRLVRVIPLWKVDELTAFEIQYSLVKFEGTTPFKFRDDCVINNPSTTGTSFASNLSLKTGQSTPSLGGGATTMRITLD